MALTPQDRFNNAVALGMAASPFATASRSQLVLIVGDSRKTLVGCPIEYRCDSAPLEENGIRPGHKLSVQIPKKLVPTKPNHTLDRLEYQGRVYNFAPVEGLEDFSPLWALEAHSPLS